MKIYFNLVDCHPGAVERFNRFCEFANHYIKNGTEFICKPHAHSDISIYNKGINFMVTSSMTTMETFKSYAAGKILLYDQLDRDNYLDAIKMGVTYFLEHEFELEKLMKDLVKLLQFYGTKTEQGKLQYINALGETSLINLVSFVSGNAAWGVLLIRIDDITNKLFFADGNIFALLSGNRFCKNYQGYINFMTNQAYTPLEYYSFIPLTQTFQLHPEDRTELEYILMEAARRYDETRRFVNPDKQ